MKTIQDVYTTEVILGAASEGGSTRDAPVLLNNVLGTKFRVVTGYPGTREILVAIERNEMQGVCGMGWDAMYSQRPEWVAKGFIRVLVQENLGGNPMFDKLGVPRSVDLAKTPEARQIMELAYAQQAFGRPYILPPGTPADRVAALRKAFMAATQDAGAAGRGQEDARRGASAVRRRHPGAGQQDVRAAARDRRPHARCVDLQAAAEVAHELKSRLLRLIVRICKAHLPNRAWERAMFPKTIIAFAVVAASGTTLIAPTSVSAAGFRSHVHQQRNHHHHVRYRRDGSRRSDPRRYYLPHDLN